MVATARLKKYGLPCNKSRDDCRHSTVTAHPACGFTRGPVPTMPRHMPHFSVVRWWSSHRNETEFLRHDAAAKAWLG